MQKNCLLLVLVVCTAASAQQVYRCTDASGKVSLSDKMCDADAVDRARVRVRPNVVDHSSERELYLRQENARLREQGIGGGAPRGQQLGRTQADLQADRSGSYECRQAQRNLEVVASSVTSKSSANRRAAEQSMRAACGMREPRVVERESSGPSTCIHAGGPVYNCH